MLGSPLEKLLLPYCCQSPDTNAIGPLGFYGVCRKIKEPTSGLKNRLPLLQLRVIIQALQ